jgi:chromosome segregation ATPase
LFSLSADITRTTVTIDNLREKKMEEKSFHLYLTFFFSFLVAVVVVRGQNIQMNPSSMAPVLTDYHKKSANLRSKILHNEEHRYQLEQKLHSLSTIDSRLKQRQQIEDIQSYFTQLNQESQRAEQRNLKLLNDITQAERNLDQLRIDAEHLLSLKHDYSQYLQSNYPNWKQPVSTETRTNNIYDFDRIPQKQNGK